MNVAVEAGIRQGWDEIIGSAGAFVGMTGFGASGPYKELYRHFGITAEAVAKAALQQARLKPDGLCEPHSACVTRRSH